MSNSHKDQNQYLRRSEQLPDVGLGGRDRFIPLQGWNELDVGKALR